MSAKEIAEKITFARTMIDHFVHGEEGMDALHEAHKALSAALADYCMQSELLEEAHETLRLASRHLDYCGYGDSWERECAEAQGLEKTISDTLAKLEAGHDA